MNEQRIIERMAEALLVVSQVRLTQQDTTGDEMPRTSSEMQRWIRAVLNDPDEQLAVVVLPHLIARLDRCAGASVKEVIRG
jgi:hypothetical protein